MCNNSVKLTQWQVELILRGLGISYAPQVARAIVDNEVLLIKFSMYLDGQDEKGLRNMVTLIEGGFRPTSMEVIMFHFLKDLAKKGSFEGAEETPNKQDPGIYRVANGSNASLHGFSYGATCKETDELGEQYNYHFSNEGKWTLDWEERDYPKSQFELEFLCGSIAGINTSHIRVSRYGEYLGNVSWEHYPIRPNSLPYINGYSLCDIQKRELKLAIRLANLEQHK